MSIQREKLMTLAGGEALYNDLRSRVDEKAPVIVSEATGNPITIADCVSGIPMTSMRLSFLPKQAGSGDPSPTNVRNISGYTGVDVYTTGKNMFYLNTSSMISDGWNRYFPNPIVKAGTYCFSCSNQWGGVGQKGGVVGFKNSPLNSAERVGDLLVNQYSFGNTSFSAVVTVTEEQAKATYIYFGCSSEDAQASSFEGAHFQLEINTTATDYEQYRAEIVQVSWQNEGGTVYGGTLDLATGTLTAEWDIIDLGTLTWDLVDGASGVQYYQLHSTFTDIESISSTSVVPQLVCDKYKTVAGAKIYSGAESAYSVGLNDSKTQTKIRITKDSYETPADLKTALDGVMMSYKLRTPQTYQLDPAIMPTLREITNVFTIGNDTLVIDYQADTKKYVDRVDDELSTYRIKDAVRNNSSVVYDGVITFGNGFYYNSSSHVLAVDFADSGQIKAGTNGSAMISAARLHDASFYGLAKAAGDTTQSASSNAVGVYTPQAKAAIQTMLGVEAGVSFTEEKTGSSVTINGEPNVKYECGEVSSLTITAPEHGTIDVWFATGSTPAMLTASNVIFPSWFDYEYLEPNMIYEFVITDCYGGVCTWERPVTV